MKGILMMSKKKRFSQMIHKILCSLWLIISICGGIVSTTFAQTEWEKYQNNPVLVKDGSIPGCWQWAAIGQPTCLYENDTIKMWYAAAGIAYIGDNNLVASAELIKNPIFRGYNIIEVEEDESYATNCIQVNNYILITKGFNKLKTSLIDLGYKILEVNMSEFRKMDGGLSCLSLRF